MSTRALFHDEIEETTGVGVDANGASARPMAVFSGFYESPGPPPSVDVRGKVPPHCDDHQNGHQSGYIIHCCFVCCCPGGREAIHNE